MKIKNITARILQFPVYLPMIDKPMENRVITYCEVETDDGLKGCGVTGSFMPWAIVAAIEHEIFPIPKDMDPRNSEAIHDKVWKSLNPRAYTGVISNALSAVDIACWDIHGQATGRTVAQLMGGHSDWTSAYITFGYPFFDKDQLVEYAKKFVDEGQTGLKMVVACDKGGWREDARRIRAVRDAVGPDIDLMIDANYKFSPMDARLLCRAVEECDLTWFEEPLHQNDARAMADLRRHTNIPISAGQMEGHRWRVRELIEHQAVDLLQPNCCYNGGYTETLKIAHLAQAYNLPIANGAGWPIFNMHTMAGVMNGGMCEFHWGLWQAGNTFFDGAPNPDGPIVRIPDRPGLGFTPNQDAIAEHTVKDPESLRGGGMQTNISGIQAI